MTPASAAKFRKDVDKIFGQRQLVARTDQELRLIAIDLYGWITKDTPVDTGHLRASWRLERGAPDLSTPPALASGQKLSEAQLESGEAGAIAGLSPDERARSIYITNSLPYALRIEYGHSRVKAPQGMVRVNLKRLLVKYGA